jgi:acylphosphatase
MLQARRFYISGMVQGVGFRFFAQRVAGRLGIAGYVKNLPDGRVEVYAIGTGEQLRAMRGELKHGPGAASVDEVGEVDEEILQEYADGFRIEDGW